MALDPQAQRLLDMMAAAGAPPAYTRTPQEARDALMLGPLAGAPPAVASVEDRTIRLGDAPPVASASIPRPVWAPFRSWCTTTEEVG